MAADAIDQAIKATDEAAATPPMAQFGFQMAPAGRPAGLMLPADVTDDELFSLLGGIVEVVNRIRASRKPKSVIEPVHGLRIAR